MCTWYLYNIFHCEKKLLLLMFHGDYMTIIVREKNHKLVTSKMCVLYLLSWTLFSSLEWFHFNLTKERSRSPCSLSHVAKSCVHIVNYAKCMQIRLIIYHEGMYDWPIAALHLGKQNVSSRKRKRSDSVLWKSLTPTNKSKKQRNNTITPPKLRLYNKCGPT